MQTVLPPVSIITKLCQAADWNTTQEVSRKGGCFLLPSLRSHLFKQIPEGTGLAPSASDTPASLGCHLIFTVPSLCQHAPTHKQHSTSVRHTGKNRTNDSPASSSNLGPLAFLSPVTWLIACVNRDIYRQQIEPQSGG